MIRALEEEGLTPRPSTTRHRLDLLGEDGLRRSRLLHALTVIEVPAARLIREAGWGLTGTVGQTRLEEEWASQWTPDYEAALVMASRLGGTLDLAVATRLAEEAADAGHDAATATRILLKAALAGSAEVTGTLHTRIGEILAASGDLAASGEALSILTRMFAYEPVLRTTGRVDLGSLLELAWDRSLCLLQRSGPVPPGREGAAVEAIRALVVAVERVGDRVKLGPDGLAATLLSLMEDDRQEPTVRGAALGGAWVLGRVAVDDLVAAIRLVARPEDLGDVVAGLAATAREVPLRRPEVLAALDDFVSDRPDADFLAAAPGLRRGFSGYTPRERAAIAAVLAGESGDDGPVTPGRCRAARPSTGCWWRPSSRRSRPCSSVTASPPETRHDPGGATPGAVAHRPRRRLRVSRRPER